MPSYTIQRFRNGFAVVYTDETGKRRRYSLEARTRKEAEAAARDVILSRSHRTHGPTVAEVWEAFRADRAGRSIAESMDFTGRSMRGMVYVDGTGTAEDDDLAAWVGRGLDHAGSLPPK